MVYARRDEGDARVVWKISPSRWTEEADGNGQRRQPVVGFKVAIGREKGGRVAGKYAPFIMGNQWL